MAARNPAFYWDQFYGYNCADGNVLLKAHQIPYGRDIDFGRVFGSAAKRYGLESIIADIADVNAVNSGGTATLSPDSAVGQTWTTGAGVTNISAIIVKVTSTLKIPTGITASIYTDATKATKLGTTTNITLISTNLWRIRFDPSITVTPATTYYIEFVSTTSTYTLKASASSTIPGSLYVAGMEFPTMDLYFCSYHDLGAAGIKGQHTYDRSSGPIPLIGHGTDVYKLSGASSTEIEDFAGGSVTNAIVNTDAPETAPTLTASATTVSGLTGTFLGIVTYIDAVGVETLASPVSSAVTVTDKRITWSDIPVGPVGTAQRKLYRTKAGGSTYYYIGAIADNTTTTYADSKLDTALTAEYAPNSIFLGPGDTKGVECISQASYDDYENLSGATTIGQTITIPTGVRSIYSISPYLRNFAAGESVTLTLYSSAAKTTTLESTTVTGVHSDGAVEFILNAAVTPGLVYYFEMVCTAGTVGSDYGLAVYAGGVRYVNEVAQSNDLRFIVNAAQFSATGSRISKVFDLATAPTSSVLNFKTSGNTVTMYARGSIDNQSWGDWQAIITTGNGLPLTRYIEIMPDLSTSDLSITPSVCSYEIVYNSGYGTATSIKSSLSGNRVHFTDWDDRAWFVEGGRPQVWDGTTCRDVGVDIPSTDPTVAASGSGSITGAYKAKVTFVNIDGAESNACASYGSVTASSNLQFDWTNIPTRAGHNRKLYRTKAGGSVYYYVGEIADATTTTYTDTVADSALSEELADHSVPPDSNILLSHKNYMFYVPSADPTQICYSRVDNPEEVPIVNYEQCPGPVLGLASFDDKLFVFGKKFTTVWLGDEFGPTLTDWSIKYIDSTGAISHESITECIDDKFQRMLIFLTQDGVRFLTPGLQEDSLQGIPLSRNIQKHILDAKLMENASAIFYQDAYYLTINECPAADTPVANNNRVFKFDLRTKEWCPPWYINCAGFMEIGNDLYMTSSVGGRVYKYAGSDDDGAAINMEFDTRFVGSADKTRFKKPQLIVQRGSVTDDSELIFRVGDDETTIAVGSCTAWEGATVGSGLTAQDAVVSEPFHYSQRGRYAGVRFKDNSTNDVVVYAITAKRRGSAA